MQTREQKQTPYALMLAKLEEIVRRFNIDIEKTDVFEEILLLFAGVKEKPKFCRFGNYTNISTGEYCVFFLDISKEACKQLMTVNNLLPQLKAFDMSETLNANGQYTVHGHPVVSIRMNADALREYFLPEFESYLAKNDNMVRYYRYTTNNDLYPYELVSQTTHEIFINRGMDTHKSDCFEETVCLLILESYTKALTINNSLTFIPSVLLKIINTYLNFEIYENQEEINGLTTTSSRYEADPNDKSSMNLFLTTKQSSAKLIEGFFNRICPRSATMDNKLHEIKNVGTNLTKLNIKNQTVLHEGFISDINDKISQYPRSTLEKYYKDAGTITITSKECLAKLTEYAQKFQHIKIKDKSFVLMSDNRVKEIKGHKNIFENLAKALHNLVENTVVDSVEQKKENSYILAVLDEVALLQSGRNYTDYCTSKSDHSLTETITMAFLQIKSYVNTLNNNLSEQYKTSFESKKLS